MRLMLALAVVATAFAGCTGGDSLDDLRAEYTDNPFKGGQETPAHLFKKTGEGRYDFLHFNDADPAKADGLMFTGDAFRAKGCVGSGGISQAQIADGYVHFHKETSANWDQGHHTNSNPNTMGYWFKHVAAEEGVDPMGIGASPKGEVYPLMPSHENAPACP